MMSELLRPHFASLFAFVHDLKTLENDLLQAEQHRVRFHFVMLD